MAQYQHLPIYKTTYDLLVAVTRITANFPKAYKYSLGDKLRNEVVDLVVYIFKANSSKVDRAKHAGLFLERLQVVELLLRIYVIRPHARYLRRSTVRNGFKKIGGLCRSGVPMSYARQTAHSYFGIFNHASAWKLQGQLARTMHLAGYGRAVPSHINNATFVL